MRPACRCWAPALSLSLSPLSSFSSLSLFSSLTRSLALSLVLIPERSCDAVDLQVALYTPHLLNSRLHINTREASRSSTPMWTLAAAVATAAAIALTNKGVLVFRQVEPRMFDSIPCSTRRRSIHKTGVGSTNLIETAFRRLSRRLLSGT